jgi:hypothetical protein
MVHLLVCSDRWIVKYVYTTRTELKIDVYFKLHSLVVRNHSIRDVKKQGKQVSDSVCFITWSAGTRRENVCLLNHETLMSHSVTYRRTSLTHAEQFYCYKRREIFVRDDKIPRQNFSVTLQSDDHWRQYYSIRLNRTILRNYLRYAVQSSRINRQSKKTHSFLITKQSPIQAVAGIA